MERSLSYAGSHSRPMCLNHGPAHTRSLIPISTASLRSSRSSRKSSTTVKALYTSPTRPTLSSDWDISGYSAATASPLPKFEDLDTSNMLLRQRIIFLGSQVDDTSADLIIGQLLFLDAEDSVKDIKLFINSPGGSVTAGMAIYDAMKMCKADISTVCMGLAASMGAFILCAGTKGKRFCMPNARVMIHQAHGQAGGAPTEMAIRVRELSYHNSKLMKTMARITGKTKEQLEIDTDRDNFMNAWEAKEYGLVDEVIDDGKPGLVAPIPEATPPPPAQFYEFWKAEGYKHDMELPSEHKLLKKE